MVGLLEQILGNSLKMSSLRAISINGVISLIRLIPPSHLVPLVRRKNRRSARFLREWVTDLFEKAVFKRCTSLHINPMPDIYFARFFVALMLVSQAICLEAREAEDYEKLARSPQFLRSHCSSLLVTAHTWIQHLSDVEWPASVANANLLMCEAPSLCRPESQRPSLLQAVPHRNWMAALHIPCLSNSLSSCK